MKRVTDIFYLEPHERSSEYSRGFLYIFDDGSQVELMSTDVIADTMIKHGESIVDNPDLCNCGRSGNCEACLDEKAGVEPEGK